MCPGPVKNKESGHGCNNRVINDMKCKGESTSSIASRGGKRTRSERLPSVCWAVRDTWVIQTRPERQKKEVSYSACCPLQDNTRGARALASGGLNLESDLGRLVEAFSDTAILNGRAFCLPVSSSPINFVQSADHEPHTQVLHRANLLGLSQTLIERDRIRAIIHLLIFPQIALERGEHDLHTRAILIDFGNPLGPDVFKGVRAVNLYPSNQHWTFHIIC